jgi:hypothetical protein
MRPGYLGTCHLACGDAAHWLVSSLVLSRVVWPESGHRTGPAAKAVSPRRLSGAAIAILLGLRICAAAGSAARQGY